MMMRMIKKHFSIWSGEEVIIERVDDANEKESYLTSFNSAIIKTYEDKRNRASINFNKLVKKCSKIVLLLISANLYSR